MSGSVSRSARARTNAPSRQQSIEIVSSRDFSGLIPAAAYRREPAAIQLSNTSAHACLSGSLALETSSAIVAIGQASA